MGYADPDGTNWQTGGYYSNPQVVWSSTNGPYGGYIVQWSGGGSTGTSLPTVAGAVTEAVAAGASAAISNTPIPISWGERRINGKVVDKIVKAIDPETNFGSEILCVCAGKPLFRDVPNDLSKIMADSTVIYNEAEGGVVHEAVNSVVWYDGTSDLQIQDPTFVTQYGADEVPGRVGLMTAIIDYNSYAPWNGARPHHTIFITDEAGGTLFSPWGGSWDEDFKGSTVVLTDDDMTATSTDTWDAVRSTVSHSSGRRYFEFVINSLGGSSSLGVSLASWGFTDENNLVNYSEHGLGTSIGSSAGTYGHTLLDGTVRNAGLGAGSGSNTLGALVVGQRYGVAFDLNIPGYWISDDGVVWHGAVGGTPDPVNGTGSQIEVGYHGLAEYYIAWNGYDSGDSITIFTDGELFLYEPPGELGTRNWGEVFVAMGGECNLDPNNIITVGITKASEGGVIYDGLNWTDFVTTSGRGTNIDWWEDGPDIYIKQSEIDDPDSDVDEIPLNHRYIKSEERGTSEAQRAAEGRKPSVVEVSAYEVSRQFQHSMVPTRSEAHESVKVDKIILPWVMTAAAMADFGSIALGKLESEVEPHDLSLPPMVPYIRLRPADIVEYDEEGKTQKTKVFNWIFASDHGIEVTLRKISSHTTEVAPDIALPVIEPNLAAYRGLQPPLIVNTSILYPPTLVDTSQDLTPPLLTNTSTLYAPTLELGSTFATLNPADKHADITLSNGDLTASTNQVGGFRSVRSTLAMSGSDKIHIEITLDALGHAHGVIIGLADAAANILPVYPGNGDDTLGYQISGNWWGGQSGGGTFAVPTAGDVLTIEIDCAAREVKVAKNNDAFAATATIDAANLEDDANWFFALGLIAGGGPTTVTVNFGDSAWSRTPTSGYVGLS
jgi:hypothetical protein